MKRTMNEMTCRQMTVKASTVNEESRTVDAVISTDDFVDVYMPSLGHVREAVPSSAFEPLPEQIPLFEQHSQGVYSQLGSARNLRIEGDALVATIHFDPEHSEAAARAWSLAKNGHARHYSIGYRPREMSLIKAGESAELNGKTYRAEDKDSYLTTRAELDEVSLVGIPANKNAAARGQKGAPEMPEKTSPDGQPEAVAPGENIQKAARTVDVEALRREAVEAERQRVSSIRALASENTPAEVIEKAIADGYTVEKTTAEILRAEREATAKPVNVNINTGRGMEDISDADILTGQMLHRTGHVDFVLKSAKTDEARKRAEKIANESYAGHDVSLVDICREVNRIEMGSRAPKGRLESVQRAFSSAQFTAVFTTSVNAGLMTRYFASPDTTVPWTRERDVSDFKKNERIGAGLNEGLSLLPRGTSADHATMGDEKEEYKINRFAKQFSMDEQDFIDDNIDVFTDTGPLIGERAAQVRPDLVYSILKANANLADGTALFHADHGNTATSALAAAALKTVIGKMEKQQYRGLNLNLRPRFLIVNSDLRFTAKELLNSSAIVIAGTAGAVTERGNLNTLQDENIVLVSDSRLTNATIDPVTGTSRAGSATTWFMAADPLLARTIEVGYLAGTGRAPQLRSSLITRGGRYGIEYDVKLDIGAKALDFRGLQRGNT